MMKNHRKRKIRALICISHLDQTSENIVIRRPDEQELERGSEPIMYKLIIQLKVIKTLPHCLRLGTFDLLTVNLRSQFSIDQMIPSLRRLRTEIKGKTR